ncbi:hypothetical protein [Microlunatus soli]|uniref:Uncharacterized protein n=1 Tax=Microlunatus soli TaxID=630515 RepID=A0A1H1NI93_9ACTN|nr:hypothetical protein [Microlunatus soli]SDR98658.1 hypothetical protein SAMN04489812_0524 [Microlunatus soli]
MSAPEQFVLAGPTADLRSALADLTADPEASVLSVHADSTGEPDRLVATMLPERAAALGSALPGIVIEPDAPLTLD